MAQAQVDIRVIQALVDIQDLVVLAVKMVQADIQVIAVLVVLAVLADRLARLYTVELISLTKQQAIISARALIAYPFKIS